MTMIIKESCVLGLGLALVPVSSLVTCAPVSGLVPLVLYMFDIRFG